MCRFVPLAIYKQTRPSLDQVSRGTLPAGSGASLASFLRSASGVSLVPRGNKKAFQ